MLILLGGSHSLRSLAERPAGGDAKTAIASRLYRKPLLHWTPFVQHIEIHLFPLYNGFKTANRVEGRMGSCRTF